MTAIDLLHGDAAAAREIPAKFEPAMTNEAYLAFARGLFKEERCATLGDVTPVSSRRGDAALAAVPATLRF